MSGSRKTIVVDVSGHGFGHLAQVSPVMQVLTQDQRVLVIARSALPGAVVADFVGAGIETAAAPPDVTLAMHGPVSADVAATAARYRHLHAAWESHVAQAAEALAALSPSALVADVSYLSLAAAQRLGIPHIALSSLNWFDIYRAYCGGEPEAEQILGVMEDAYRGADVFLQASPHLPMTNLPNRRPIGPIARIGRNRRAEIDKALGLTPDQRLVLTTQGGITADTPLALPAIAGVHWLAQGGSIDGRADVSDVNALGIGFIDVLASADVVVAKLGYGTFVEAACNGVALVSAPRPDWPENDDLIRWVSRNANYAQAAHGLYNAVSIAQAVDVVLRAPRKAPVVPTGIAEAVTAIRRAAGLP